MPPMRASSPSARSSSAEMSQRQPAHHSQRPPTGTSAAQAANPVTSRSVVRWLGVTPVPTNGRTRMRAKRWLQEVPITASVPIRRRRHAGIRDRADEAPRLDDLPSHQRRDAEGDFADALQQGELDRRLRADAEQAANQHIAALLHPQGRRDGESHRAQRLTEALDDEALTPTDRYADQMERQHHFEATQEPGDEMMSAGPHQPRRRGVERFDRAMQPGDVAERRPGRAALGELDQAAFDEVEHAEALRSDE